MSDVKLPRKQLFDLVGESFSNVDGTLRQDILRSARPGDRVRLVREPNNSHGSDAILVVHEKSEKGIGYISGAEAHGLAAAIDGGVRVMARVHYLSGGLIDYPSFGCQICVVKEGGTFRPYRSIGEDQVLYFQPARGDKWGAARSKRSAHWFSSVLRAVFK